MVDHIGRSDARSNAAVLTQCNRLASGPVLALTLRRPVCLPILTFSAGASRARPASENGLARPGRP